MCKVCEMLLSEERKLAEFYERACALILLYSPLDSNMEERDKLHEEEIEILDRLSRLHDQWDAEVTHEIVE